MTVMPFRPDDLEIHMTMRRGNNPAISNGNGNGSSVVAGNNSSNSIPTVTADTDGALLFRKARVTHRKSPGGGGGTGGYSADSTSRNNSCNTDDGYSASGGSNDDDDDDDDDNNNANLPNSRGLNFSSSVVGVKHPLHPPHRDGNHTHTNGGVAGVGGSSSSSTISSPTFPHVRKTASTSSTAVFGGAASTVTVVPGRPRRKRIVGGGRSSSNSSSSSKKTWRKGRFAAWTNLRLLYVQWMQPLQTPFGSLFLAVLLWYCLGVLSIGTTQLLLTPPKITTTTTFDAQDAQWQKIGGVPALYLTFQQFLIGSTLLRFLISMKFMGSVGLQPIGAAASSSKHHHHNHTHHHNGSTAGGGYYQGVLRSLQMTLRSYMGLAGGNAEPSNRRLLKSKTSSTSSLGSSHGGGLDYSYNNGYSSTNLSSQPNSHDHDHNSYSNSSSNNNSVVDAFLHHPSLLLAGLYFTFGFLTTNMGFSGSSAAFVETIKAAEPITSASVAVLWGIEVLSRTEVASLATIVLGVLLSTVGNHKATTTTVTAGAVVAAAAIPTVWESVGACAIVMASNLCFSFRGLYQKLLRATPEGSRQAMDDLNLQFRMQQMGLCFLFPTMLLFNGPCLVRHVWHVLSMIYSHQPVPTSGGSTTTMTVLYVWLLNSGVVFRYLTLALINGCAFTSYNLASTFILSRISVVHHAALNCIRRIFAIIVTSILFQVPMTVTGAIGICISFVGFMSFTHFKVQRQKQLQQPKPAATILPLVATNNNNSSSTSNAHE